MTYRERIAALTDEDPAEVEEAMRCQYGTLDHLDAATFDREVKISAAVVQMDRSERRAWSALGEGRS